MIDPIIFSIEIGNFTLELHWYGVLIAIGVLVGGFIADAEIRRRGGKSDHIWDALIWVLPAAIVGARLWYVLNATFGGSTYYTDRLIRVLYITEGGLHIFGGILFGIIALYLYARTQKVDLLLLLDSVAPSLLIGQAVARPANFINQELYGPPTDLPWGIRIQAATRIPPWNDLQAYPVETTRFHPTFAYEMIWNLIAGGLILWVTRKYQDKIKPGTAFAMWLVLAGVGRFLIETFRPDQPTIPGTGLSYSRLVASLMAIIGTLWLLIRYKKINIPWLPAGPNQYRYLRTKQKRKR